mmetsp:Transcript_17646/g.36288  ORF Transcript_17646/g.36288 Transcript_17646/m.36288 type:complete len:512 (+) Transcript_17646:172-1707(+)|eukprot:CAMPEP_0201122506 /NCGR_PEP_ID=MMETSP0850-20130426/6133_1 /ASSEMBLY_ACC=CAM_ASM_000622 /TAXON_ID=183588 /ORGANISM="Pseudo-nitzschia fraudulenta, Strain WWA7" /LENGTH=511 /DNA_ID=CAMNT_0047389213 /DNA_START=201 /DNA_END=1736 /DNA_ORIENTATION=+
MKQQGDEYSSSDGVLLGRTLAKACIDAIIEPQQDREQSCPPLVVLSTPLAAIAVALHAALRSDVLGFVCMGVPEDKNQKQGGFAPPVRELPRSQFLPRDWDKEGSYSPLPLRYRKADTGAVVLKVEGSPSMGDDNEKGYSDGSTECSVTFVPTNNRKANVFSSSTADTGLRFPLSEHIDLDSWNTAAVAKTPTQNKKKIDPSLLYRDLSGLMSKFCTAFDVGEVKLVREGETVPSNSSSKTKVSSAYAVGKGHPTTSFVAASAAKSRIDGFSVPSTQGFPTVPAAVPTLAALHGFAPVAAPRAPLHGFAPSAAPRAPLHGFAPSSAPQAPLVGFAPAGAPPAEPQAATAARVQVGLDDKLPAGGVGLHFPDPLFGGRGDGRMEGDSLQDPRFGRAGGRMSGGGNLMGPNHPVFGQGGAGGSLMGPDHPFFGPNGGRFPGGAQGGIPFGGPGTMQPRFDPIVPPGIGGGNTYPRPGGPGTDRGRNPKNRHYPGEPDPDHLPPPNSLGNNMFM